MLRPRVGAVPQMPRTVAAGAPSGCGQRPGAAVLCCPCESRLVQVSQGYKDRVHYPIVGAAPRAILLGPLQVIRTKRSRATARPLRLVPYPLECIGTMWPRRQSRPRLTWPHPARLASTLISYELMTHLLHRAGTPTAFCEAVQGSLRTYGHCWTPRVKTPTLAFTPDC